MNKGRQQYQNQRGAAAASERKNIALQFARGISPRSEHSEPSKENRSVAEFGFSIAISEQNPRHDCGWVFISPDTPRRF
jgi:hypothetical protein